MEVTALFIGYTVLCLVVVVSALFAALVLWAVFPIRAQFGRDLPSHWVTPTRLININLLAGIGSRRQVRWFFGLLLLEETDNPRTGPRVLTKKSSASPPHDERTRGDKSQEAIETDPQPEQPNPDGDRP